MLVSLALILFGILLGVLAARFLPTPKTTTTSTLPESTPTSEPTATWKTYTNQKLGLEFMYPNSWLDPKESSSSAITTLNFDDKLIILKGTFSDISSLRPFTFDEYVIRSYGDETPRYDYNEIVGFVGKRGLEKSVTGYSDLVILAKDNNSTEITSILYRFNLQDEDGKLFDQILSTLKFTVEGSSQEILGIQLTRCCSCPTIIDSSQIGENGWILYEQGKDYSALRPKICSSPNIGVCAPCPPLETKSLDCQYNGKTYKNGETVSVDKCNSCSCDNGQVACTLMACE
ncbi:TPA: hypothetical protein DCZ81_03275 [Candidatus Collierbacteria bacterium]|nr:hypothetical protein [Candidatus Collierbacteria bacterium]HCX25626.1 hypothetical protein [Candidatus Collierbacteria bacterium]